MKFKQLFLMLLCLSTLTLCSCFTGGGTDTSKETYTITVIGGSGSAEYQEGSSVTVVAEVQANKTFLKWVDESGKELSKEQSYIFTAQKSLTLKAVWAGEWDYTYTFNENTQSYTVSGVTSKESVITVNIPSTYQNFPVTTIGDWAFGDCDNLETAVMGDNITYIGDSAFYGCQSLKSIELSNNLEVINYRTFDGCRSLKTIVIPEGVKNINKFAFCGCRILTSVTLPSTLEQIYEYAFVGCYRLVEVYNLSNINVVAYAYDNGYVGLCAQEVYSDLNHPSKVKFGADGYITYEDSEKDKHFLIGYVGNETSLTLPDKIANHEYSVSRMAFCDADELISVTITSNVTSIGESVFEKCDNLSNVQFTNAHLTSIGERAFASCYSLISITLPSSLITLEKEAFLDSRYLRSVNFAADSSLTTIKTGAFQGCYNLVAIAFPSALTTIDSFAFAGCTTLISVKLNSKITNIGSDAFSDCPKLVEVYNPSSLVISAGSSSYGKIASNVLDVYSTLDATSKIIHNANGLITYADVPSESYYLLAYEGTASDVTLPSNINGKSYVIYQSAFQNADQLVNVTIPNNAIEIRANAFQDCDNLQTVTIDKNSELTAIGENAFAYCEKLATIYIPAKVTMVGRFAFAGCSTSIECAGSKNNSWHYNWNPNNCPVKWEVK